MSEDTAIVDPVNPSEVSPQDAPTPAAEPEKKGRQMSFTQLADGSIQASFGEGIDPITLSLLDLPESITAAAVTEGVISRLRGYTSKLVDDKRTPAALAEAVAKGIENLKAGVWKIERDGVATPEHSIEVEAAFLFKQQMAAKKGVEFTETLDTVAVAFAALTPEQVKQLKGLTRYQLCYAEVKDQRSKAKLEALRKKVDAEEDNAPI